ncbi:MAG TPA: OmpA family protein, partial [Woeseiaceae bacterium]
GSLTNAVRLRGTLTATSSDTEPFPLLLDGRRVEVPALHLRGSFAWQEQQYEEEYWVLADSAHPLLLKMVHETDVWQMVRVELPGELLVAADSDVAQHAAVESGLQLDCRAELPGIYFAFGTADLHSASERTLSTVADVLQQHQEWKLAVEGHTDNVGSDSSNRTLSLARAEAVRNWLVHRRGIAPERLSADGFGASMPRESNGTVEGRARNRRVELARACD